MPRLKYQSDNPVTTRHRCDGGPDYCRKCLVHYRGSIQAHLKECHPGLKPELYFVRYVFEESGAEPEEHEARMKVRVLLLFLWRFP